MAFLTKAMLFAFYEMLYSSYLLYDQMKLIILLLTLFLNNSAIPNINKKVVEYVDTVIGEKVARGECWDLAAAALDYAGAYLDRSSKSSIYIFGNVIDPKNERIFPGDIIQIEDVKLEYSQGNMIFTETMTHHTAIIYSVEGNDIYKIAHQNTSFSGKKVGLSELNMSNVKKGNIIFYRPYKN